MLLSFASTATGTAMHESLDADSLAEDLLDDALLALLQDERPEPDRIAPRESAGPAPSPSPSSACVPAAVQPAERGVQPATGTVTEG